MQIKKYKYLNKGKYKIYIDDDFYVIYEDIIIKYNLLSLKTITEKELEKYLDENSFYEAYYDSINYLSYKNRCKKEIKDFLQKKNISSKNITIIIDKLQALGYLNEKEYCKCYVNDCINLKDIGPNKIKKELLDKGLMTTDIENALKSFTKDLVKEKIIKFLTKKSKLNKNKSTYVLKQKLTYELINKGYERDDINKYLDVVSTDDKAIYEKEYQKLYNKLKSKYSGYELENIIKQKLYQKGLKK